MLVLLARRLRPALCGLVAVCVWAGCAQREAGDSASAPPPAPVASQGTMKVALVTPGPISDKGWNASAYEGGQRIGRELGVPVSPPVEKPAAAEVAGVLRNLAQEGHTLVFIHASEYDDAARQVAPDFPQTTFVVVGGRSVGPNLTPIQFGAGQATFLAGMLAAGMSKTGKIGAIGGKEIPIVKQAFAAFEQGAKTLKPAIDVTITFTGADEDPGKAKQQAQALLDNGVDVLTHNANAGGLGVFQAVGEKPGTLVIGANADQSDLATGQNLGSFLVDAPSAMLAVARKVKENKGDGTPYLVGLKENAVGLKYNSRFQGTIPADLKAIIEKARTDIIAGTIDPTKSSSDGPARGN